MLVFSLAEVPLSVSQDATQAVNLLYCRSPSKWIKDIFDMLNLCHTYKSEADNLFSVCIDKKLEL